MKTHRVGVIGLVHDHVWGELRRWQSCPGVEICAAADPNEPLRKRVAEEFGVKAVYADWREMVDKESPALVQVAVENSGSADVLEYVAPKGIHAVSEKPMAATLAQADRMLKAAREAGTQLLINWPTAWRPPLPAAVRLVEEGAIGQLYTVRTRMSHGGPKEIGCSEYFWGWLYDAEKNGAGALMDYCCYGAAMARTLLGMPRMVMGVKGNLVKPNFPVDDNAIITMVYDRAFAVAEASWTQVPGIHDFWLHGSEGMLWTEHGKVLKATKDAPQPVEVACRPLPEGTRSGPEYLLSCLEKGTDVEGMCSAAQSRDAQEILEAGLRSSKSGQAVQIPLS